MEGPGLQLQGAEEEEGPEGHARHGGSRLGPNRFRKHKLHSPALLFL